MIDKIIHFSIHNKLVIGLLVALLAVWGIYSAAHLPLDAVPDITNNQVQLVTSSPALAPQEVERFITFPVELAMANLPGVELVRSISRYGLSVVTVVFEEGVETMRARQLVGEKLALLQSELDPALGLPYMMPITTGLGEIYQYTLEVQPGYEDKFSPMDLRTLQDWQLKRRLSGIAGVIEVSSFGGYLKQYEVAVDPQRLRNYGLSISDVFEAVANNNGNAGGSYIEKGPNAYYVRSEGLITRLEDLAAIPVKHPGNTPLTLGQLAELRFGHAPRYGAMTQDGKGEAVGGIVLMMKGANANETLKEVHKRVDELQASLPEGVRLVPYLDRSDLVGKVIETVSKNLVEGGLIVVFILILLLGNFRAGLVVASVIPLSMLFALAMMRQFGVSANLMSLGAIDFGLIVDGAVIIVESIVHRLHTAGKTGILSRAEMDKMVYQSAVRIRKSAAFGEIIILIVYLPILALVGVEGKMFRPMAMTVGFAILGALLLSLTYVPMMSALFLSRKADPKENWSDKIMARLSRIYRPALEFSLANPRKIIVGALLVLLPSLWLFTRLGAVFIPSLEEGDLAMQMTVPPGSSLSFSIANSTKAEKILLERFPEVKGVVSKIGTAEIPTDPMAVEDADIMILLKPKEEWTTAQNREALADSMKAALNDLPGVSFEFTQPIQLRFNELLTGVKSDIAVKIYGEDLATLAQLAEKASTIIEEVDGAADVLVQQTEGLPQLMIRWQRDKLAAYQIDIATANQSLQMAYAGAAAGKVYEGEKHFEVVLRLQPAFRQDLNTVSQLQIRNRRGDLIPLSAVADIRLEPGPMLISRENTNRLVSVLINVRDRDYESFVEEVEARLKAELALPSGYFIRYGGQFENLQAASRRLAIAVPIALALIFLLLYFTFGSWLQAAMIFTAIPLSAIGGIAALWLRDMPFSISAGVGFIALFGVAVLNGIVLIAYFNQLKKDGMNDVVDRVRQGSLVRLRPVLMTAAVASLGFLPMALSTGNGGEVQRPLATVVIGGLITATLLTLLVLPALYLLLEKAKKVKINAALMLLPLLLLSGKLQAQSPFSSPEAAIRMALAQHPEVKQAQWEVERAEKMLKSSWDPGEFTFDWQRGQLNAMPIDNFFTFSQPLGKPLMAVAQHRFQRLEKSLAQARLEQKSQEVAARIFEYWQRWAWQAARLAALEAQKQRYAEFTRIAKARYASGAISLLALTIAENQEAEAQMACESARIAWLEAVRQLQLETGTTENPVDSLPHIHLLPEPPAQATLPPAWRWQQQFAAQSQQAWRVEQYKFSPTLSAGYFIQELENIGGFQGWQLTVGIPLWFAPRAATAQSARLRALQANSAYDFAISRLEIDRQLAAAAVQQQKKRIDYYEDTAAKRAQFIAENSEQRFKSGEIDYVEFLQAMEAVLQIRLNQLEARYQYQMAAFRLMQLRNQPIY
jgi:cobalt-zinc-cadmium resistance protein CzcA